MIKELIQVGEPTEHRGIVVTPLFPRRDPVAVYLTLDEALQKGLRIAETSASGSVPELAVDNPLEERVLLYDGEELLGAKQNRILNVSVLVEAKSTLNIPVSCVEQGRWSSRSAHFRPSTHISHVDLRLRKAERLADRPLARGVAQGVVWDEVGSKATRMSVQSPTGASDDIHRAYREDLRALQGAFPGVPGQCGAILAIGDKLCLDLVSRPDAFALLWPKLRAGYLLDALERLDGTPTPREAIESFVGEADRSSCVRQPSEGLGDDLRLRGERLLGSGLEFDGELIQLSAFRSEDGGWPSFRRARWAA